MEIIDRIYALMEQKGKMTSELCRAIGVSTSTAANWKTRRTDPPAKLIYPISEFLGVSCEFVLTGKEAPDLPSKPDELTEAQRDLLEGFSALEKMERQIIIGKIAEFVYNKKGSQEISAEYAFNLPAHISATNRVK